jgi:hypothetical protein
MVQADDAVKFFGSLVQAFSFSSHSTFIAHVIVGILMN